MPEPVDYDKALLDPSSVFSEPEAILERADLNREQKVELLRRWEYDAREVAVADEEGMTGGKPLLLRRVVLALEALGETEVSEHSSPTKQDGP